MDFNITRLFTAPSELLCDTYKFSHNHAIFQLANMFLLISYLAPTGLYGLLFLRTCLVIASLLFSLWAFIDICSIDTLLWNLSFFLINSIYVIIIVAKIHPFIRFPRDVELVYRDLFKPLRVSRHVFNKIFIKTREIQTLKPHDLYCIEGKTPVDKLSLLISGRMAVIKKSRTIHLIDSHQFVDSPEWFGSGCSDMYQVTIMALEECRLIVWHRDKLKLIMSGDSYLQTVMDNILGKDLVKKLLFVTDTIGNNIPIDQHVSQESSKLILPVHTAMDSVVRREINHAKNRNCFWTIPMSDDDLGDGKSEENTNL